MLQALSSILQQTGDTVHEVQAIGRDSQDLLYLRLAPSLCTVTHTNLWQENGVGWRDVLSPISQERVLRTVSSCLAAEYETGYTWRMTLSPVSLRARGPRLHVAFKPGGSVSAFSSSVEYKLRCQQFWEAGPSAAAATAAAR